MENSDDKSKSQLMQYAGMAMQFLVSIGIGVFVGLKVDQWINFKFPVLVWMLPLLIIIVMIYKLIKDTSKPK
jgi:hypothetical protein